MCDHTHFMAGRVLNCGNLTRNCQLAPQSVSESAFLFSILAGLNSIGTYAPLCLFKMMQCRLLWMECTSKCDCVKSMKRAPNAIILRDVFAARFLLWMCSRPEIRLFKHGAHRFVQRARFCLTELTDALECAQMDDTTASNQAAAEIWEEKPSCCRLIGSFSPYNEDFSVLVSPRMEILQKMSASNSIFCNNCCQTLHYY